MASLISNNYAEALLMLAKEQNAVLQYKEELKKIEDVFNTEGVMTCFNHPNVIKEEKKQLVKSLIEAPTNVLNFLMVLIDKSRIGLLNEIIKDYNQLANSELGIKVVYLTSAKALSDQEKQDMIELLKGKLNQEIELVCRVDERVLAGIKLEVEGKVLDNTAASKLAWIKEKVENITLKIEV